MISNTVTSQLHYVVWQDEHLMGAFPNSLAARRYAERLTNRSPDQLIKVEFNLGRSVLCRYQNGDVLPEVRKKTRKKAKKKAKRRSLS